MSKKSGYIKSIKENKRFIISLFIGTLIIYFVKDIEQIKSFIVVILALLMNIISNHTKTIDDLTTKIESLEEQVKDQESYITVHEEQIIEIEKVVFPNEDIY